jgi:type VI secretion system lysozyme-like protein
VRYFGIEDISLLDLRHPEDQEELRRRILGALERFEPRLEEVRVLVEDSTVDRSGTRFHIEGRLVVEDELVDFPILATVHWNPKSVTLGPQS